MRILEDIGKLDFGTWGVFDLITFIVLIILNAVLLCIFLGFLLRRLFDFTFPSARKRISGISEDELERPEVSADSAKAPFYIEDGILDEDTSKYLARKGVGAFDMAEIEHDADKRLADIARKEEELNHRNDEIVRKYYEKLGKNNSLDIDTTETSSNDSQVEDKEPEIKENSAQFLEDDETDFNPIEETPSLFDDSKNDVIDVNPTTLDENLLKPELELANPTQVSNEPITNNSSIPSNENQLNPTGNSLPQA